MASEPRDRARRAVWIVAVLLLLGAAGLWGAAQLTWFAEYRDLGVRGTVLYTETGGQRSVALVPLALLALAGIAGVVATGGWPRRLLGTLLVLAGLTACVLALLHIDLHGEGDYPVVTILTGHGLAVLGGLLVTAAGVLTVRAAADMPRLGARYTAHGGKRAGKDPDAELWDALSDGEDPTASG